MKQITEKILLLTSHFLLLINTSYFSLLNFNLMYEEA